MPLSADIVALIRTEIGFDTDFVDQDTELTGAPLELGSLESIYTSPSLGKTSILITALVCWRQRMHSLQARSFDVTTQSTLLSRSQRVKFINLRIKELELLVESTAKGRNEVITSVLAASTSDAAEFS